MTTLKSKLLFGCLSLSALLGLVGCFDNQSERSASYILGLQLEIVTHLDTGTDPLAKICATPASVPPGSTAECAQDHSQAKITFSSASDFPYEAPPFKGLQAQRLSCDEKQFYEGLLAEKLESTITVDADKKLSVAWNLVGDIFSLPSYGSKIWLGGIFTFNIPAVGQASQFNCDTNAPPYASSQPDMTPVSCEEWTQRFSSLATCRRTGIDP